MKLNKDVCEVENNLHMAVGWETSSFDMLPVWIPP